MSKKKKGKPKGNHKRRRLNQASVKHIEEDNMRPMLVARCREMGWSPTVGNLVRVRNPIFETHAGRMIVKAVPGTGKAAQDMIAELYQVLTHIRRVRVRYLRAKGAPKPDPKIAAITMVPERFEVTSDLAESPEPLAPEEEYARACAAHKNLQRWLSDLDHAETVEVIAVAVNDHECRDLGAYIRGLKALGERLSGKARAVA